jgi:hypothetical protein
MSFLDLALARFKLLLLNIIGKIAQPPPSKEAAARVALLEPQIVNRGSSRSLGKREESILPARKERG